MSSLLDEIGGWAVMLALSSETISPIVLAEYTVRLRRPTPTGRPLRVRGRVVELDERGALTESTVEHNGEITATAAGRYVRLG